MPPPYHFRWGFCELQQQLWTATKGADMTHLYADVTPLAPQVWRIMAAWNMIQKRSDPGASTLGKALPDGHQMPSTSNRDWYTIDCCINDILKTGADVLMIIGQGRPGTSASFLGISLPFLSGTTVTADDYGVFCGEVAERYKPGGVGIRTDGVYSVNSGRGVTMYEVWNEENNSAFWGASVNPKKYVDYLKAAYTNIKAVSGLSGSSSEVVFGGMQHVVRSSFSGLFTWAGFPEITFLQKCYAYEPNLGDYFDVMAEHIYTQTDKNAYAGVGSTAGPAPTMTVDNFLQLVAIHDLMDAKGDIGRRIYITELGYHTASLTEAQQRDYTEDAFELLDDLSYVDMVLFYEIRDIGIKKTKAAESWGPMYNDFTKKALWTDFLTTLS